VRDDRLLARQADEIEIGLDQRRAPPTQQPRLRLAHEAGEQRRQADDQDHLHKLEDEIDAEIDHGHAASTRRSVTSAPKTTLRYCRMVRNCSRLSRMEIAPTMPTMGR